MEYDSHAQNEMMRFLEVDAGAIDENIGDLDLSEDGASSVASSTDIAYDGLDFPHNDSVPLAAMEEYGWTGPVRSPRQTMLAQGMPLAPMPVAFDASPSPAPSVPSDVTKHMQELIARIQFGATADARSLVLPDREDFGSATESNYEYAVTVDDFPERSRVETQIKCRLSLSHALTGEPVADHLLHLPADTIARPRFQLTDESQLRTDPALASSMLWLSVDAVNQDVPEERVLMCPKCLARERKRAFRKKAMDPHEETYWNEQQARRVIIFNCKEVVPIDNDGQVELPLRIACYCRHHAAKNGYRLVFVLRDSEGKILGRTVSSKVFITDNHKEQRKAAGLVHSTGHSASQTSLTSASASATSSGVESSSEHYPMQRAMRRQSSSSSLNVPNHPYMRAHSRQVSQNQFQQFPSTNLQMQLKQSKYAPSWISDAAAATASSDPISAGPVPPHQALPQIQPPPMAPQPQVATVFRAIPPSGSVRGGVEITLLGQNFRPNLVAMFGESPAVSTQCWSDSTIIAHLPASNQTGPVPVTFQGQVQGMSGIPPTMFTYVNDGEDKLKEIALQMIGYKMTGKIEDAGDIAQRIVVKDEGERRGGSGGAGVENLNGGAGHPTSQINTQSAEQFALWVLRNIGKIAPERFANVNLRNTEGQSMMHLASMLGYASVVRALIAKGGYVDIQDVSGLTPLHFAVLFGNRNITRLLLQADADPFHRTLNGQTALDIADPTVSDLLPKDQRSWYNELNRRGSSSSLMFMWNREEALAEEYDDGGAVQDLSSPQSQSNLGLPSPEPTDLEATADESLADDESDDDFASGERLPSPPSYSKLFPVPAQRRGHTRRTSTKTRRTFIHHRRGSRQTPVIDIEISSSSDEHEHERDLLEETPDVEAVSDVTTASRVDALAVQKSRSRSKSVLEIYNDKMLFTFWIPLWVITFASIVAIYVAQKSGSSSAPMATRIADFASRCTTAVMNRILPTARRMQPQALQF